MIHFTSAFNFASKNFARLSLALLLCFVCVSPTPAQDPDDDVLRIESNLVQLNVGVVDRQGRAVTTLSRGDFVVYEDGVKQPIMSFEPTASPFSLVLLLDMSGSTKNFRQMLKQTAVRFIDALSADDRVAVIAFNEKVEVLTKFTTDRRKIAEGIVLADGGGQTEFYNALRYSLELLSKEGKRRKAIVVLTDGVDTQMRKQDAASVGDARTNEAAIAKIKPDASGALNEVLNAADRQGVTIYPLALPAGDPKLLPELNPTQVAVYTSARTRLQSLANRTGGRLSEIRRLEDLGRLYAQVAADMRALYTIAYQPSGERTRDGRWRTIRIEVVRPELIARTRPGYYAR